MSEIIIAILAIIAILLCGYVLLKEEMKRH